VAKFCTVATIAILIFVSTFASPPTQSTDTIVGKKITQLAETADESVAEDSLDPNTPSETQRRFLIGEPATIVLLGLGLAGVAIIRRRFN